ncbi:KPN_02809 family neutral zinc metallopeptidase [Derxia gummosa]|uniref:KPN_02809 family neutral zinc metallopeptidase n=1 Tax=Derxia gummosa DSM 723 TaxID=1121388 RepID=A0A8B6X129_9BURK|nr:neutral zinc metallopeptidase [Derxia gummosa]
MRWEDGRESANVEDARGSGGGGIGLLSGGLSLGSIVVALVAGWVFGINPLALLGLMNEAPRTQQAAPARHPPADDQLARFVAVVLADTEDVWHAQFRALGRDYREPKLRLFTGREPTACGTGQAAMGPFYCPADEKVYIDLGFYDTMRRQLGAPGDFAQAYVIAHEVGHHVQHLLGISDKVQSMRARASETQANALSVRLELQADCLAGLWAHHAERTKHLLEPGDIDEALNAATQIGDDTLQHHARGTVVPESFTHGSGKQRLTWFRKGFETGRLGDCDTFRKGAV